MDETLEAPNSDDINTLTAKAAEAARQAEEANSKANSEALFAFNAKKMAEEHATNISELKGRVEADAAWFTTTRQGVEQAQAVIATIKADMESAQRTTSEAVTEVEKNRVSIKEAATGVDTALQAAGKAGAEVANLLKSASQHSAETVEREAAATAAADSVAALLEQVTEQAEKVQEQFEHIGGVRKDVDEAYKMANGLVTAMAAAQKKASEVLAVIQQHEADLSNLKGQCDLLHKRIESLLPNATSAGLATAFRDQKARFEKPQWWWLGTFVVTIVALLISSLVGLPAVNDSWDSMARHLVNRLPLIAPLVWLAIYAGRHYGLALRLQEEYAYKEAVSAAFEGYKREMTVVGSSVSGGANPLVTLCENVLRTLGQRPGRIYEGKHEDITVLTPVATAMREGMEAATGVLKRSPLASSSSVEEATASTDHR